MRLDADDLSAPNHRERISDGYGGPGLDSNFSARSQDPYKGASPLRIIVHHLLPNTLTYVIVAATLSVPSYILGEVALSFLGVGIEEPQASWGNMLNDAQNLRTLVDFPWMLIPGVFIFITVFAFNFFGDGIRDALDPKYLK